MAKSFQDENQKLSFAVANRIRFAGVLAEFGLEDRSTEAPVVTIRTAKGQKYAMTEEFT